MALLHRNVSWHPEIQLEAFSDVTLQHCGLSLIPVVSGIKSVFADSFTLRDFFR